MPTIARQDRAIALGTWRGGGGASILLAHQSFWILFYFILSSPSFNFKSILWLHRYNERRFVGPCGRRCSEVENVSVFRRFKLCSNVYDGEGGRPPRAIDR